jgi:hypothetical protein
MMDEASKFKQWHVLKHDSISAIMHSDLNMEF